MRRRLPAVCLFLVSLAAPFAVAQDVVVNRPDAKPDETERKLRPSERRSRWFRRGRTSPDGRPAAEWLQRAVGERNAARARRGRELGMQSAIGAAVVNQWQSLGPAPMQSSDSQFYEAYGKVSGRVAAVAVDPTDPNIVYIGAATGGVWKSTNAAAADATTVTWTPLIDGADSLTIGAIAIKPDEPNVILVGTGEAKWAIDSYYGVGVLRSTDGGQTWTKIQTAGDKTFVGSAFSNIVFSSTNPNLVVATVARSANHQGLYTSGMVGIYTSTDGGATWSRGTLKDSGVDANFSHSTGLAYNSATNTWFAAVAFHGIYKSTDGLNWTRLTTQPDPTLLSSANCPSTVDPNNITCDFVRAQIATVKDRNEVYVWLVDYDFNQKGVFKSTDNGATWNAVNTASMDNCGDQWGGCGASQSFYNMTLRAVANGTGTDVYAGAINVFKCTLASGSNACTGGWLNLTHVYGCYEVSYVHPDQHAIVEAPSNPNIIYIGNDGGIYRTLTANTMTPTTAGGANTCVGQRPFDNLNTKMGSTLQFVWFSQSATDPKIILGGTQDNGSPATTNAGTEQYWMSYWGGDGGYNAIHPTKSEWYVNNYDVSIQRCTSAPLCRGTFIEIVNNGTLDDDASEFYPPYVLDGTADQLFIGTCRVWRTSNTGTNKKALSNALFGGSAGLVCEDGDDMVRAIAVGGQRVANVASVIWAGTTDGKVFLSVNAADAATPAWTNVTPPGASLYPVSSITLDPADSTGRTAYVTLMGFQTAHVFKSTNGGVNWTNLTNNLPNAPANSFAIDPDNGSTIYIGTDVGVFVSTNSGATWAEFGTGLPNVPVTQMQFFRNGLVKKLRVSTYGRGIWEMDVSAAATPDFTVTVNNPGQAAFLGNNTVTYTGKLTALNGYNQQVTITCANGTPATPSTCTSTPVTPTATGADFSVTVNHGAAGYYSFNLHAAGTDGTAHDKLVTYRVMDYALSTSSASIEVPQGGSTAATITVTPAGEPVGATVNFSCGTLPAGMTCTFVPASQDLTGTATRTVQLFVGAATTTPGGTYNVEVIGTAASDATTKRTVSLNATVISTFDLGAVAPPTPVRLGESAQVSTTVTATTGYSGTVEVTCSTGDAEVACTPIKHTVNTFPSTISFAIASAKPLGGTYTATLTGDDGQRSKTRATPVSFGDFTASISTPAQMPLIGGAAVNTPITITSRFGYVGSAQLSCSIGAAGTCQMTPPQVNLLANGNAPATAAIQVLDSVTPGNISLSVTATDATLAALQSTTSMNVAVGNFTVAKPADGTIEAGGTVTRTVSFTAVNGYNGDIAVTCSAPGATSCTPTPTTVKPGVNTSIAVKTSTTAGPATVTVTGTSQGVVRSATYAVTATDYALAVNGNASATVAKGQSATYKVDVNSTTGHAAAVTFACSGLPYGASCSFSPATINGTGQTTITVTTRAPGAAQLAAKRVPALWTLGMMLPGLALAGSVSRRRKLFAVLGLVALLALLAIMPACGGGGGGSSTGTQPSNPGTPSGSHSVTVTATSGTMQKTAALTLVVQ